MMTIERSIIKTLMNLFPVIPEASDLSLNEIFKHKNFVNASDENKRTIMLNSAEWRCSYEENYPFEKTYFKEINLKELLQGKTVLDLGCFTGGRSIAWAKRYNIKKIYGIDVDSIYTESAHLFAKKEGVDAHFHVAFGEELPFSANFFDAIMTFDTFEHVRDIKTVLIECQRVLKDDGILICSFPHYLSPFEHHLGFVTKMPCLHWFFNNKDLNIVYNEIIESRGSAAYWYKRSSPILEKWEKLHGINGTSIRTFRKIIEELGWQIYFKNSIPLFKTGRLFNKHLIFKLLSKCFTIFAKLPYFEEFFCERIVYILKKVKKEIRKP